MGSRTKEDVEKGKDSREQTEAVKEEVGGGGGAAQRVGLRHEPAHWHEYNTSVKMRWAHRSLLEVFVTEFRDRTGEYYQWAIHKGLCRVNGQITSPEYKLKQSDRVINKVHRHEPAVTSERVRILYRNDEEGRLVVVKPGSIPVHPAGRYFKMTLLEMLKAEHGIQTVLPSNRLDRLTSGIMICSTRKETAHRLSEQFAMGKVRKAYVCRVKGRFPPGETTVNQPLLHCDRQTGISIVHPVGKYSETIFNFLSYDDRSDSSVVYCRPITGRTHQIRVHVQFLGHPIVNDPVYAHPLWTKYPPSVLSKATLKEDRWMIEPGSTLSVYGSPELDSVVEGLKMDKDTKDDWARWRDEILFGKLLAEEGIERIDLPGFNALSPSAQRERLQLADEMANGIDKAKYCSECMIPLVPDPKPDELFIYLHAIKYQTDDWTYEDQMPWWALSDWQEERKEKEQEHIMPPAFGLVGRGEQEVHRAATSLDEARPLAGIAEQRVPVVTNDDPEHPRILFDLMGGMEDFALKDLETQLSDATSSDCSGALRLQLHTGYVFIPSGHLALAALRLFRTGHLSCVKDAYVEVSSPSMPVSVLTAMAEEKRAIHEASRIHNHKKKKKILGEGDSTPPEKISTQDGEAAMTEQERAFVAAIQESWRLSDHAREQAFSAWKRATNVDFDSFTRKPRFRVTVDRRGYSMPTLTTFYLERMLGSLVWTWLNGEAEPGEGVWDVDLTQADLNVTLKLLPAHSPESEALQGGIDAHWRTREENSPGHFSFSFAVPAQHQPRHRMAVYPNHLIHGGTALARFRSYTLAIALPLMKAAAAEREKDDDPVRLWEPCAGSGSMAVEIAEALKRRGFACSVFASDVEEEDVGKAKEMMDLCHQSPNDVRLATVDAMSLDEAVRFVGGEDTLDGIVTDLPWGRRVLNHASITKLYPAILSVFVRMLKPGACALLMTAENKTLLRALKAHEAEARRKAWPFFLHVEHLSTDGFAREHGDGGGGQKEAGTANAPTDDQRASRVRTVHCGYVVSVILLRKRALLA